VQYVRDTTTVSSSDPVTIQVEQQVNGGDWTALTLATVHFDQAATVYQARAKILETAFLANPKRFKGKCPLPPSLPNAVWINPPTNAQENLNPQIHKYTTIRH